MADVRTATFKLCTGPGRDCRNKGQHASQGDCDCPDPSTEIDRLTKVLVAEQGLTYAVALQRVMSNPNNSDVVAAYHQGVEVRTAVHTSDASSDLDTKVRAMMANQDGLSYSAAAAVVIRQNPSLAARWNAGG